MLLSMGAKTRELGGSPLTLVASPALAAKIETMPADLAKLPLIHYTRESRYRWDIDACFRDYGIWPEVIAEADDVILLVNAAVESLGVVAVPRDVATEWLELQTLGARQRRWRELHGVRALPADRSLRSGEGGGRVARALMPPELGHRPLHSIYPLTNALSTAAQPSSSLWVRNSRNAGKLEVKAIAARVTGRDADRTAVCLRGETTKRQTKAVPLRA